LRKNAVLFSETISIKRQLIINKNGRLEKLYQFSSSLRIIRIECIIKKIGIKKATLPNILSNDEDKKEPKVPK
jgi:hypothetical protein